MLNNKNNFRHFNTTDNFIDFLDTSIRTLFGKPITTDRDNPNNNINHNNKNNINKLSSKQKHKSAALMRVNHCGEVCAQALYQGQAITTRDPKLKIKLKQASLEENDHLAWCATRVQELDSHTSYLNPVWYLGSLSIGIIAGLAGDKYNLGFLAETENQVTKHLDSHLNIISSSDYKSINIIKQMKIDEAKHEITAIEAGGVKLPTSIKYTMQLTSKVMTTIAYYI